MNPSNHPENAPVYNDFHSYSFHRLKGRIVFTNGCFDIIHRGHIELISAAKRLGDHLIIGLNSDTSVGKLKGVNRPVNKWADRASVLSALRAVDAIIKFEEETPIRLIKSLKPDIITKGGDYTMEQMIGKDFVESYGGQVIILPFVEGLSSSRVIDGSRRTASSIHMNKD